MAVVTPDPLPVPPASPVVLIATGNWWALAARIAIAFARNDWRIAAVCPAHSPLSYVKGVGEVLPLSPIASRASLTAAIRKVRPGLLLRSHSGRRKSNGKTRKREQQPKPAAKRHEQFPPQGNDPRSGNPGSQGFVRMRSRFS